jgi:hypothetical protein
MKAGGGCERYWAARGAGVSSNAVTNQSSFRKGAGDASDLHNYHRIRLFVVLVSLIDTPNEKNGGPGIIGIIDITPLLDSHHSNMKQE